MIANHTLLFLLFLLILLVKVSLLIIYLKFSKKSSLISRWPFFFNFFVKKLKKKGHLLVKVLFLLNSKYIISKHSTSRKSRKSRKSRVWFATTTNKKYYLSTIHYYKEKSSTQVAHLSCTKFSKIYFFCLPQVKKVKKIFSTFPDVYNNKGLGTGVRN